MDEEQVTNPPLRITLPLHLSVGQDGECTCGAKYKDFRCSLVRVKNKFAYAKRYITRFDGDGDWYWSRRTLLWVMSYIKQSEWTEKHRWCNHA